MKDTLNTIIYKSVEMIDTIDILNKVDQFYNSAWDKLIIMATISFGIVGILVPIIIQWYQKKSIKLSEDNLKSEIEKESSKIEERLTEIFDAKLDEKMKVYEEKIEALNAASNAKAFHIQGAGSVEKGDYYAALCDFITASFNHLKAGDYMNLQNCLTVICDTCLPHLSREEINDIKISHEEDLDKLIEFIKEKDLNGALTNQIRNLKLKVSKLPEKK